MYNLESLLNKALIVKVSGDAARILLIERLVLNIISRASGIATLANYTMNIAKQHQWSGIIAGTRKTTPGFRLVEKYALLCGGCSTHRFDTSSMIMIKDNHIMAIGSITLAVKKAKHLASFVNKIEVNKNFNFSFKSPNSFTFISCKGRM